MTGHFVYIIQSLKDGSFYKSYSTNPAERLLRHNQGLSNYSKHKLPWKLVYVEQFEDYKLAIRRERNLKKATVERLKTLLVHPKNIVAKFLK